MYVLNLNSIKAAMARRGIRGFTALARRTGVHRNTIGRFVWKREPVLPESVSRILDELELSPAQALERVEERAADATASGALAGLVDELVELCPKAAYVLFGSRARGDARRYSDFDIGVFSTEGVQMGQYLGLLDVKERHEDNLPWFVDLVNLNNADVQFLQSIAADLRFLAGRQGDWQALQKRCHDQH